jgi:hypothetical protein
VLLGTADPQQPVGDTQTAAPQLWSDPVTADTDTDTVEEWDIINLTVDGEWDSLLKH